MFNPLQGSNFLILGTKHLHARDWCWYYHLVLHLIIMKHSDAGVLARKDYVDFILPCDVMGGHIVYLVWAQEEGLRSHLIVKHLILIE